MESPTDDRRCPLCDGSRCDVFHTGIRYGPDVSVCRCPGCGLVCLDPLPLEEELVAYYAADYREEYAPGVTAQSQFEADREDAELRAARLRTYLKPGQRLLEIGSGSGAFLHAIREDAIATGIEPTDDFRAWGVSELGLDIRPDVAAVGDAPFDAVVLFHVLEHVLDPVALLESVAPLLADDGALYVEVPNVDDALFALYEAPGYAPFIFQKAHLWYFSTETLRAIFEKAGWEVEVTGLQRYDLSNHLRWLQTGRPGGAGHYRHVFTAELERAYADALVAAGHGDTLWAVANRPAAQKSSQ